MSKKDFSILELGCGNGRDALFFSKKGCKVKALDLCEDEIRFLNDNYKNENLEFFCVDFCNFLDDKKYNGIYSRFTLHSVSKKQQDNLFKIIPYLLKEKGLLCIEARGKKNSLFGKGERVIDNNEGEYCFIFEEHFRRFLDFDELKYYVKNLGLEILYAKEDKGFAPFKNEDDYFIRLIAQNN
ncbi:TPA: class I SAM-dependent methyltransferase [Campylobacter jejuni]|nr:class I SAM-dependent methyltransferase [Campylobacter jejuni]HEC1677458.1 class I SAM-dependent methyltransferase [Campylobacter jejuni]HEC1717830.1 class I SAM-dependent methyltransferase [Campylobacter jejuni]